MRSAPWWLAVGLIACSGTAKDTTDTSLTAADTDTDTDADADTDTDTDTDTDVDTEPPDPCVGAPVTGSLSGTVLDANGSPVADTIINACSSFGCIPGDVDPADGTYSFDAVPACPHSIDVFPPHEDGWATPLTPLMFDDGEHTELNMVLVKSSAPVTTPATAAEVEVTPGLFLTVGLDTVELLFGDVSEISGVEVDSMYWPTVIEGLPGTPIAMWYLDPFDAESEVGMPIRFSNSWGLEDGTTYDVYNAVYDEFAWVYSGEVTVSGDELSGDASISSGRARSTATHCRRRRGSRPPSRSPARSRTGCRTRRR
jgi:hypothetical protein